MNFIPYKVNEVLDNVFYQIPKELLVNPIYNNLDSNSILLYGLLLDRLSVSMKNKWFDKDGNIYLIYSRKEAQKMIKEADDKYYELRDKFISDYGSYHLSYYNDGKESVVKFSDLIDSFFKWF